MIASGRLLAAFALVTVALANGVALPAAHAAAIISVLSADGAGEGLNDPTPVAPVGGNAGNTLGAQRRIALEYAAALWGAQISSTVEIELDARFDPLFCQSNSAVLGSAGAETYHRDFAGAPRSGTWYTQALANKLAGIDLEIDAPDVHARFNSRLDEGCLSRGWYYGLDGNSGDDIDFVTVALHELGHGLGFLTLVDKPSGAKLLGYDDAYMVHLEHHGSGIPFPDMTNAQRAAAMTDTGSLHWIGPSVAAASGGLVDGVGPSGHVEMYAPSPVEGGSSVSHFSNELAPNELMEPAYTEPLGLGLTTNLLEDIGWGEVASDCGNGELDTDEECDDGAHAAADGCDGVCRIEQCWVCAGVPSICAPASDGTACDDGDACTENDSCTASQCAGTSSTPADETFVVDDTADAEDAAPGDGLCATAGAACTLRAAVEEANRRCGPNTVNLPAGTYALTQGSLRINDPLVLHGAGAESSIIDGGGIDRVFEVLFETEIDGVTLQNGSTSDSGGAILSLAPLVITDCLVRNSQAEVFGGGIQSEAPLVIERCALENNSAVGDGGAISSEAVMHMTDCTVAGNHSGENGGGIWMIFSTLTRVTVTGNSADGEGGGITLGFQEATLTESLVSSNVAGTDGGGIHVTGLLRIADSTIESNEAGYEGGGIASPGAQLIVDGSIVRNNTAVTAGGGVASKTSFGGFARVTISASTIDGNSSAGQGGGLYSGGYSGLVTMTVTDTAVTGNSALSGGGIYSGAGDPDQSTLTVARTTLAGNSAEEGGGLYTNSVNLTVENVTASGNTATEAGGGLRIREFYASDAHLNNVTVAGNSAPDGGGVSSLKPNLDVSNSVFANNVGGDCGGSLRSRGHNLFEDPAGCSISNASGDLYAVDPLLDVLADNGGATHTLALLPGSPLIEAGAPAAGSGKYGCAQTDQRGIERPRPAGALCDVGAYERDDCHNGAIDPSESCDDGNATNGDGCSADCQNELLGGDRLSLREDLADPSRASMALDSRDPTLAGGRGNESADDPVAVGASLRIVSTAAGFDVTYPMPNVRWRYTGALGANKGYRYRDSDAADGPITSAKFKLLGRRRLKVSARGSALAHSLAMNPSPVAAVLRIGTRVYCFEFGGETSFDPQRSFEARGAARPASCAP